MPAMGPLDKATEWVWREDELDDHVYATEKGKRMLDLQPTSVAARSTNPTTGTGLDSVKRAMSATETDKSLHLVVRQCPTDSTPFSCRDSSRYRPRRAGGPRRY
jgi:hypothetical protein